ncbi:MAG: DUF423 domain-containing protein [Sphingobium sp.]|nr:DUF423 domain-containing protein [Sphingobium sp.]
MLGFWAALSGALAITAGAFGAHGAASPQAAEWLRTGGIYQMVHAVAVIALMHIARWPAILMLVGAAIFATTLYGLGLGGPKWLGAVTPIGGTLMIIGWLWAGWAYLATRKP